jgi:hypothetical protein
MGPVGSEWADAEQLRSLMMEAVSIYETAVSFYQTTRLYISELEISPTNDWFAPTAVNLPVMSRNTLPFAMPFRDKPRYY